jgi:hypothetical protein
VRRLPDRARYDRATVHAILDEGLVCHVGFVDAGQPFVIPSSYARVSDRLVLHGSAASRMVKALAAGAPACVTVTLLDGLVLARSGFHHSMNYRSVVVVGVATEVAAPAEKRRALDAIVEHVAPGRVKSVRPPSHTELRGTRVVTLPLDEASARSRTTSTSADAVGPSGRMRRRVSSRRSRSSLSSEKGRAGWTASSAARSARSTASAAPAASPSRGKEA